LAIFSSEQEILRFRIEQLEGQRAGLALQKDAYERRLKLQRELVERLSRGAESGVIENNVLTGRKDALIQVEASLGEAISDEAQVGVAISEARLNQLKLSQEFKERANRELRDIQTDLKEIRENLTVAQDIYHRTEIRAPSDGVVQDIRVTTEGSVIRPGEILMEIVPPDDNLLIASRVSPLDIDNVMPGQESEVRFSAFKAKLTPVVLGYVESVSQDIITPERSDEEPYYLARVRVPEENMSEEMRQGLTAGMPADVVIVNGERSVLNYLVSPLTDAIALSLREE
jgi:HlyD family type I secretion membrane fusion protein